MDNLLEHAAGAEGKQSGMAEKRDLLERMLARLAHEIRNPLSSLDIHVQLLDEDLGTLAPAAREQVAGRLEIIQGELHRLESIVDNFLRLAGPSALDPEPVALGKVAQHVCDLLRAEAASREIEIKLRAPAELPEMLADPVRLTQALMNLLINALQAVHRKGEIEVTLSVAETAMCVEVRDNGPGIPPERLESIFDPYFTTKPEGTGLGLWIAHKIVAAHGGTLRAENAPAGGARFTMTLPLRPAGAA